MRKQVVMLIALAATVNTGRAQAQAWIGNIVGQMADAERANAEEAACRAGTPSSDKVVNYARESSQEALDAYQSLSTISPSRVMRRAFALKKPDVSWKNANGKVPITELGARLDEPKPLLTPTSFIVAGDGLSARGIWKATWADQPSRSEWYAVDFTGGPHTNLNAGTFRIWHMSIFPGEQEPQKPAAYCHYDPDQAW